MLPQTIVFCMIINGIIIDSKFAKGSHCDVRYEATDLISTILLHQRKQVQFHIHFSDDTLIFFYCLSVEVECLCSFHFFCLSFLLSSSLWGDFFFFFFWAGIGRRALAAVELSRAEYPGQEMSSPNCCFPLRRCDKVSARGLARHLSYG